jgi:hypothetical protein
MPDRLPPRRPLGQTGSAERYPNPRERIDRARRAAKALFAPKPSSATPGPPTAPTLPAPPTPPAPEASRDQARPPSGAQLGAAQAARIRTWVKYGMTVAEVAAIFGVPVEEVERVLRKS